MNIIDLTNDAISKIEIYRKPDISDWFAVIDPILDALGVNRIGTDTVESIFFSSTSLVIYTSFEDRCGTQHDDIRISLDILNADDPIKAANKKRLQSDLDHAQRSFDESVRTMERLRLRLETVRAQFQGLGINHD